MIPNNQKHREKSKQSNYIYKPEPTGIFSNAFGSPETVGLYAKQRKNSKKK